MTDTFEHYIAHEDVAFHAWLDARRDRIFLRMRAEEVRDLCRSAFLSGARFGKEYRAPLSELLGTSDKRD